MNYPQRISTVTFSQASVPLGKVSLLSTFLFYVLVQSLGAQATNRPLPPGFPDYWVEINELAFDGHYCTNAYQFDPETSTNMFILDSLGYIAWYRKDQEEVSSDFKYHEALQVFSSNTYYWGGPAGVFYTYDSNLNPIDTLFAANGERGDRHDFLLLPNGNKIIGTLYDTIMDLRAYAFNNMLGMEDCSVRGFGIQEFNEDHELIWAWHSTDVIHPSAFADGLNYNPNDFDYAHGNALFLMEDGNLLVSLRNTSAVYKIDRANRTGEVLWELGGENSSFTFADEVDRFSAQHFTSVLPNGQVGLFDNGNLGWPNRYSRAVAYDLDEVNATATLAWEYDANQEVFSSAMGNAQWINDSLVLIGWGYVFRPDPTFSLVNYAGEALTNLYFQNTYMTYRVQATHLDFTLPRPYLSYENTENGVLLHAPVGYEEYVWSTGDTTATILVQENGEYQAWVPHGIGWVGSYPLQVSEVVGIQELPLSAVSIFPNPASEQVYVEIDIENRASLSLGLYDVTGSALQMMNIDDGRFPIQLDISSYPPGLYFVEVQLSSDIVVQKLIIH